MNVCADGGHSTRTASRQRRRPQVVLVVVEQQGNSDVIREGRRRVDHTRVWKVKLCLEISHAGVQ